VSGSDAASLALLVFRIALGVVFLAHGWNHVFGGGKIAGTGRWFESLGMRPGWLHAWTASLTELGAGALLVAGLAMPLACAGVIGTMTVAWITNHRRNGFFIFRPGEGLRVRDDVDRGRDRAGRGGRRQVVPRSRARLVQPAGVDRARHRAGRRVRRGGRAAGGR
jgi:uncharacterized membrane protein YphA (DoxX/SURF4 family)